MNSMQNCFTNTANDPRFDYHRQQVVMNGNLYNLEYDHSSHMNNRPLRHQQPGQFDKGLRSTEFDYSDLNREIKERSMTQRFADSDGDTLGLRSIRNISRNSGQQMLVDAVREKNFQTQQFSNRSSALMGSTPASALSSSMNRDDDLLCTGIAGLTVNDLDLWGRIANTAQLTQPIRNTTSIDGCRRIGSDNSFQMQNNLVHSGTSSFGEATIDSLSNMISNGSYQDQYLSPFSDFASSAPGMCSDSENFNHCPQSVPSSFNQNTSSYNHSAPSLLSHVNEQMKVIDCISHLSKEELDRVMKIIQEVPYPVTKEADRLLHDPASLIDVKRPSLWTAVDEPSRNGEVTTPFAQTQRNRNSCLTDEKYDSLDLEARNHHVAAECGGVEPTFTWRGELPKRRPQDKASLSTKVFIGGLPYQTTEETLKETFKGFDFTIEWPGKGKSQPKGYVYFTFQNEAKVQSLLNACRQYEGNFYYQMRFKNRKSKLKEIQVIPWYTADSSCAPAGAFLKVDPKKTVYVGAIHGTMTARALFRIMNDLFEGVIFVGICVDKHKYPTGSARVCFNNSESYMKAVTAGFVNLKTSKFSKTIQIDPFLADSGCSVCHMQIGPYFCRKSVCFRYFCKDCWRAYHEMLGVLNSHKPLTKNSKQEPSVLIPAGLLNFIYSF